jgi:hypothetical protein
MAKKITTTKFKRGFYSKSEIETLKSHLKAKLTVDQISLKMNRATESVQREINKLQGAMAAPTSPLGIAHQLEIRPEWKKWQEQFTKGELEQFKNQYVQIMAQFDNNVKPTEELQIFQVITLIILIDRTLAEQKRALDTMDRLQVKIDRARSRNNDDEADMLESQFEAVRAVSKTCADKYKTYSDKQDKMLQQLKGTRDQRIKNNENGDKSFVSLLKWLMEEDNRMKAGEEMAMFKEAAEKERIRMSQPHKYIDGTVDRPLLSSETIHMNEDGTIDEEAGPEMDVAGDPAQLSDGEVADAVPVP